MSKLLLCLGLMSALVLPAGASLRAEDEKPKKGKLSQLKDKLGGGKLTDEQRDKLFDKLDINGDGKLSKVEFEKVTKFVGQNKVTDLATRAFDKLDADGDGFITKKEFEKFGTGVVGKLGGLKGKLEDKFGKKKEDKEEQKDE